MANKLRLREKRNQIKTQKKSKENIIKSVRNVFKLKKENEIIKSRIIRNIRAYFEQEDDRHKPIREDMFWNNN